MSQVLRPCGRPRARTAATGAGWLLAVLWLAGCSAALDWRQVQPDGWSLVGALPCKPATQQRQVALAGQTVVMTMVACTADGHTFALVSAELGEPARVQPALQALGQAARANLQGRVDAEQPALVPGMTPNPAARRWRLSGQLPNGQAAAEQVQVFAHGTRVFQAAVVGAQADDARAAPFFDALKVLP
jgi:hypothetical protein